MDNIDVNRNYLIGLMNDPDSSSQKLYDDLVALYFCDNPKANNRKQQYGQNPAFYTIETDKYLLSADYIGPSVHWAQKKGVSDVEIMEFLKICRTIGGHIVWQRGLGKGIETVNQARGGASGVYDRFDWTLLLLQIYLSGDEKKKSAFVKKAKLQAPDETMEDKISVLFQAFSASPWLNEFKFNSFCDKFYLHGSFVSKEYRVVKLAPWFPILPTDYSAYINKVSERVTVRNKLIQDIKYLPSS